MPFESVKEMLNVILGLRTYSENQESRDLAESMLQLLEDYDFDIQVPNKTGQTILSSVFRLPLDFAIRLLRWQNLTHIRADAYGLTPLHYMVLTHSHVPLGGLSIYKDINKHWFNNPLVSHADKQRDERFVLEDSNGPVLIGDDYLPIVRSLIDLNIDVNAQDLDGNTALHYLMKYVLRGSSYGNSFVNTKQIMQYLIDAGADLTLRNKLGETALDLASRRYVKDQGLYEYQQENIWHATIVPYLQHETSLQQDKSRHHREL